MSNVNDNDMDSLFQRASERYPLRTDSADWDRLAAALDQEPAVVPVATGGRTRRRWLWLLLLLPLAGVSYYTISRTGHKEHEATFASTEPATGRAQGTPGTTAAVPASGAARSAQGTAQSSPESVQPAAGGVASTPGTTGAVPVPSSGTGESASGTGESKTGMAASVPTQGASRPSGQIKKKETFNNKLNKRSNSSLNGLAGSAGAGNNADGVGYNDAAAYSDAAKYNDNGGDRSNKSERSNRSGNSDVNNRNDRSWINPGLASLNRGYGTIAATTPQVKKDSEAKKDSAEKKKKPASHKNSSFYAGLIGAPDYSSIHLQASKGVGSTFGILLGYSFNKRWAVETGVYLETKKYYTKGKYFDTKSLHLGNGESIDDLDGTCKMWEIPLNIRYNFNTEGSTRWFATAGISTYLMTSEKYNAIYQQDNYGNVSTWPEMVQWKGGDNYLFSIFNISAGFEQRIGKSGNLRIEPYWRVPLSGLGHGNLSILSTGLNIGYTRRLW